MRIPELCYPQVQLTTNRLTRFGLEVLDSQAASEVMNPSAVRLLSVSLTLASSVWAGCARDHRAQAPHGREELVAALQGRRLIEPRLTGGFSHSPCSRDDRGFCGFLPGPDSPSFGRIVRALAEAQDSEYGAIAANLLSGAGDPARVESVVATLERSLTGPPDAAALSDLAAAYLVRADLLDDPLDLVRAATAGLSAVEVGPDLPEARFNLALTLERLSAAEAARTAWQDYLRIEDEPGWTAEAEARLRTLRDVARPASDQGFRTAREEVLEELLPSWGDNLRAGREDLAERALERARLLGAELAPKRGDEAARGDPLIRDIVAGIDQGSPMIRRRLARAWTAFGRGSELYRLRDNERALRELERAALDLEGSPGAPWARVGQALCAYQQGRYARALELLDTVEPGAEEVYPALLGRTSWIRGTIAILQDRPAEAFAAYRLAMDAFKRAGEPASQVAVEIRWTAALESQGAHQAAWRRRLKVLREAALVSSAEDLQVVYAEAAHASLTAAFPQLALVFLDETLLQLQTFEDPALETIARRWRAAALERLGQIEDAGRELLTTRRLLSKIADPSQRSLGLAEVELQEASLLKDSDPEQAIARLTDAIERFRQSDHLNLLPRAYLTRARVHRRLGGDNSAAADLEVAIRLIENRRARAESPTDRARFLADVREVYEEAVDLEVRVGSAERAFGIADRLHARVLHDALEPRNLGQPEVQAAHLSAGMVPKVQRALPEGASLLAFLALPDRLLRWSVDRDGSQLVDFAISAEDLDRLVRQVLAAVHVGDREGVRVSGERLSSVLLASIEDLPETLLVVPDGALHDLPFDLLVAPDTKRPLLETTAITIVPSASVLELASARAREQRDLEPDSLLVVADPSFFPREFPELPRLPGARGEAGELASFYPRSAVFSEEAATRKAVLAGLAEHPVVHLAAHAVASSTDPSLSYLVLADGPLYAHEIAARRFEGGARVVVLSACGTGRSSGTAGEGLTGFSLAFLEAGSAAVVGTLWPVDDRATEPLTIAFHKHLVAGADPAAALRSAKLERMRAGDPPAHWAAFELIGATAPGRENQ